MTNQPTSQRIAGVSTVMARLTRFFDDSTWARRKGDPAISDFVLGNPHAMPLEGFVDSLRRHLTPRDAQWFAYKTNEPAPREVVAASLRERSGEAYEPQDVFLTNGAFAALAVALSALIDPGDEVVFVSPSWFFYEPIILAQGGVAVRARADRASLDLDVQAIERVLSERTRAVIVNSPNNPTGKVYPAATLRALARALSEASERHGRPIYLLSDEAYNRIVFDELPFPSPTAFYPNALLLYTYGKTLLTPGQRCGYIALPPTMPERAQLRSALVAAQFVTGFAFPNALLQHALADLDRLTIDVGDLQRKRDRMVAALRAMGYALHVPEGTFYLLVRSPLADDGAFLELLAEHDVFCLPGSLVELPGTFRVSLTASDAMIERALPGFEAALARVGAGAVGH